MNTIDPVPARSGTSPGLIELSARRPGVRRWVHGLSGRRHLGSVLRRCVELATDLAGGLAVDACVALRGRAAPLIRVEAGSADPVVGPCSVALYVHFSSSGEVSSMVRQQLDTYRSLGFRIVFITMSAMLPENHWNAVRARAELVIQRRNFGLDFGAWKDVLEEVLRRWPNPEELLLVNDSVLGPLCALDEDVETLRGGGDGLFGLLESWQGGPHLQSWFVLARGRAAVDDLVAFLRALRLSASKWLLIRRAEQVLGRHMLARGHRVAARYGYAALLEEAITDPEERAYLLSWKSGLASIMTLPEPERLKRLRQLFWDRPLNPAHHLWRVLMRRGCPFLKTELIRRNPGGLPNVKAWAELRPISTRCRPAVIRAHLATLERPGRQTGVRSQVAKSE